MHVVMHTFFAVCCFAAVCVFTYLRQKEAAAGAFVACGLFWVAADLARQG